MARFLKTGGIDMNLEPIVPDRDKIINFTENGQCSRYGNCCASVIPVTEKEKARLKQYAADHGIEPKLPSFPCSILYLLCPFFSKAEKKCLAYDVRPAVCRVFRCDKISVENIQRYARSNDDGPSIPTNLWTLFGKTGIRLDGREVTTDNAPSAVLTDENNIQWHIQVGRPIRLRPIGGGIVGPAIVLIISTKGLAVSDCGKTRFFGYDEIEEFL